MRSLERNPRLRRIVYSKDSDKQSAVTENTYDICLQKVNTQQYNDFPKYC